MQVVIIDENGKKVCIDTLHPHHSNVKTAVTHYATAIAKLAESSIIEARIKTERENMMKAVTSSGVTIGELEEVVPEMNSAKD